MNHCHDLEKHDSTHPSDMSDKHADLDSPSAITQARECRKRVHSASGSEQSTAWRDSFNALSEEQKAQKCQSLAKEIKQLRRKVRTFDAKVSNPKSTSRAQRSPISKLFKAADQQIKKASINDQKDALMNLLRIIAEGRMSLASLQFKQLCTIVRSQMTEQEVNQAANPGKDRAAFIYLPERKVVVSQSEINSYSKMACNGDVLRLVTGNGEPKQRPDTPVIDFSRGVSPDNTLVAQLAQNYCLCSITPHNQIHSYGAGYTQMGMHH